MTKKQNVEIAIFAAKEVLGLFEEKYPDDDRPRKAIEAAENWLKNPTSENAAPAYAAADAAADAAAAAAAYAAADAYAAYAADAAADAAAAAYAAADAYAAAAAADAYAAYAAAAAADAYAAYAARSSSGKRVLQEKIIREAVRIMERDL